MGDMQG